MNELIAALHCSSKHYFHAQVIMMIDRCLWVTGHAIFTLALHLQGIIDYFPSWLTFTSHLLPDELHDVTLYYAEKKPGNMPDAQHINYSYALRRATTSY